jgi:two-component system OmpR family sensor kinase
MISSYNKSIGKIKHILNIREMFNKIFMHEMKMPIAKGMFYLKLDVSQKTHDKLGEILYRLNQELDEFSQIESLITYQEKVSDEKNSTLHIINEAIEKVGIEHKKKILITCDSDSYLKGNKDLWVLCFKNIVDNALKYSLNNELTIKCNKNKISFINEGEPLPVDLSKEITNWKIDKNQRHKSSTGYGFGLFIIKTIITTNRYKLDYVFNEEEKKIEIIIS